MSRATGGPRSQAGPPSSPASRTEHPQEFPARAGGIQLLGRSEGSGYREAPSLVRRADGQTLQLTRVLYLVLEAADGTHGMEDIARREPGLGPAAQRRQRGHSDGLATAAHGPAAPG